MSREILPAWVHDDDEFDFKNLLKILNKEFGYFLKVNLAFDLRDAWKI